MKPHSGYPDRRKFEAELPNDLWQSDVMHGPLVVAEPRKVEVMLSNTSYGYLQPVDLAVNCRVKRDKNNKAQIAAQGCDNKSGEIF